MPVRVESSEFTKRLIENRDLQKVLRETDSGTLSLSLKNATAEVQEKIFQNISVESRNRIVKEIGAIDKSDIQGIERSRKEIVELIFHLAVIGEIEMD